MLNLAPRVLILILGVQLAMSLTLPLKKNEQFCTFSYVEKGHSFSGDYVISGFNEQKVNAMIYSPGNKVVFSHINKREGKWDLVAQENGEYKLCFRTNDAKQKYVSFHLNTQASEEKGGLTAENIKDVKGDFVSTNSLLRKILQNQSFQKTRENIHKKNQEALLSQIHWSSFFKIFVLVSFAGGQLYVLTSLFKKRKAGPYV